MFFHIPVEILNKLRILIAVRIVLLVFHPLVEQIGFTAFGHEPFIDRFEIGKRDLLSPEIVLGIDDLFDF